MNSTTPLHISDPEVQQLALELSQITGETVAEAVTEALRERLDRKRMRSREGIAERLMQIGREAASRPVLDPRDPDEMLYDEFGLPK
jgi:antitoxin VapB